ncbi:MAG: dTDP-4-dehydrorhamnose 3,5-epimerase [Prevotella sp.]|nr:dTDP-4-dehydrorhamnose 3,5-epimerase [Bacteroides sp.]MCM1365625.1 dTDP-4-dehydrorhamnose 3,5-epimerase [Prevotella sp.]
MELFDTEIEGLKIIIPKIFKDSRGYFCETFSERRFRTEVANVYFVQDNESRSTYGVVRGLHFQKPPYTQGKLVRCTYGEVIDVALDLRKGSKTFGKYVAVKLSAENHRQFWIPEGFAHGFSVISPEAVFEYKCTNYYHPESEGGIAIDSEGLNIDWGITESDIILSPKDTKHPDLKDFESPF